MSILRALRRRAPDFVVYTADGRPYLRRWWVIPRNPRFNIYLHHFAASDDDRALHDHPWWNISIILAGEYLEHLPGARTKRRKAWRPWAPWRLVFRRAAAAHRIELLPALAPGHLRPAWTLFITGRRVREWGFWCPQGWRHWREFTARGDKGKIGPGCEG